MKTAHTLLAEWLASTGRKQTWLAAQIGVRPEAVCLWLNGRTPQPDRRSRIEQITAGAVKASDWQ